MGDTGDKARYRAFLSYSHVDAAFARRLHRRLERYRLPRRLIGRATPQGAVPAQLTPIFRDREELPAATDLSRQVQDALAASERLIVVCSPAAATSAWVRREVTLFRSLHPDRPVLAVVAMGDPAMVLAEILGADGGEPIAADFRAEGDGPRLGFLKLVAGAVGVGLDELIQRDAQRRLRRVTAVTAAAMAGMVAMSLLTVFAFVSRGEAERQRTEAEGMVDFMRTNLRSRLKAVGRLDILTATNARTLQYYEHQDVRRLPKASLERRAGILQAMGEDEETRGDLAAAVRHFREARRTTEALLASAPDDPKWIYAHAQSEFWVAFIDWRRGRLDAAAAGFQRYADLAQRLLAADPSNPDWRMEAGYAANNLGMLALRDRYDAAAAERYFRRALQEFDRALAQKRGDADIRREIADSYGWLADSQRALRRFDEARASRREEARLLGSLSREDPKNTVYARDRLGNALGMAQIELDAGRPVVARELLVKAYAAAAALAADDAEDTWRAKQKIATGLFLAKAMLAAGASSAQTRRFVAECDAELVRNEQELRDFCAVIAVRRAPGGSARSYLAGERTRLAVTRRSPRWGIDFQTELNATLHLEGDGYGR